MKDNIIVTIARQYGSGGHEVGELVAKEHGFAFHDKSLIEKAAEKSGISLEVLKKADEKTTPSFLYSIAMGNFDMYPLAINMSPYEMPINDKLFNLQCNIIKEEAEKAPSVFVGRCADYILNDCKRVIKVFIYGDIESRANRIAKKENISVQDAKVLIYKTDKRRANYYNYYTSLKWGKSDNYNIMIDTSKIGVEGAARIIGEYIKHLQEE
ncbi:MAG: cytidylate kinase-like family protein [Clostridia bacterium]|nr:cytidylate kinase-like family protein [Clostridia bacterium]MBP3495634.1 cytidylate kinase-like family protein [Clostridia bacterium]